MRNYILLFFLCASSILYSQYAVKGFVYDAVTGVPLNKSLIQIYENDTIALLNYGFSDKEGRFNLNLKQKGDYLMKVTSFGYESIYERVQLIGKDITVSFNLNEPVDDILNEIVIIAHSKSVILKEDNLEYNLKSIRDSTEVNLGDLIKKLPGLKLTEQGKVEFQGVSIDKILINGNEFFGKKQQIATKNISADMVEGISLLLKNQDNVNLKDFEEDSKIALNVTLNESSKNKVLGDVIVNTGVENKFSLHSNLFYFLKNGNISIISDYNNIGEMPLTVSDYIDIIGGLDSVSSLGATNIDDLIPEYIYSENKLKSKTNFFTAFNFAYTKNKLKINSNVFLNTFSQIDERRIERIFLANENNIINENYFSDSENFLLNTIFSIKYNFNSKSNLSYDFSYSPSDGSSVENIQNNNNFLNNKNNKNIVLSNTVNYDYRLNSNVLFQFKFISKSNRADSNLNLNSSNQNLLNFNTNELFQTVIINNNDINLVSSILYKKKKNKYKFSLEVAKVQDELFSEISEFNTINNLDRSFYNFKGTLNLVQYLSNKLFIINDLSINNFVIENQNLDDKSLIENNFLLGYKMNQVNNFSIGFSNKYNLPSLSNQLVDLFIDDFQTLRSASEVKNNLLINTNTLSFSFNNFLQEKEQFLTFNLNFSFADENVSTNSLFIDNFINVNDILVHNYKNITSILFFDRKLRKIPVIFKSSISVSYIQSENQIQGINNTNNSINSNLEVKLLSNLKNSTFQVQLSYLLKNSNFEQTLSNQKYNLFSNNLGINILSKFNNFKMESELNYLIQRDNSNRNSFFILSPKISYEKNRWTYSIITSNILNIHKFEYLNQFSNDFLLENSIQSVIPGYALLGLRFRL
jgi:hypothetical protein